MNYFVYVLCSLKNGDIYVGSTGNLKNRVHLHNLGRVKSTKGYTPWELIKYYKFKSRPEAVRAEKFYKSHQQREGIKNSMLAR